MVLTPTYSIVVPLHNEARRIAWCMDGLYQFARLHAPDDVEIVLVENGSSDSTWKMCEMYAEFGGLMVQALRSNKGKGAAVAKGMLMSTGKYRLFTDVDLSVSANQFMRLFDALQKFDVVLRTGFRATVACEFEWRGSND